MWKTRDCSNSKDVYWYSEEEYKELEEKLAKYEEIMYNMCKVLDTCNSYKYDHEDALDEVGLLDKFDERWEREWNAKSVEQKVREP